MANDIKNCPFCGGEANLFSEFKVNGNNDDEYAPNGYSVKCECEKCGAKGKEFISLENPADVKWENMACTDAIKAWNMRCNENDSNPQINHDISDVALKMALAYAHATYETELKNGTIPLSEKAPIEIDQMNRFYQFFTEAYEEYNNSCIEETLLSIEDEE